MRAMDGCAGQASGAVDLKGGKWVDFDGNLPHCTLPFTGTRYTLIVSAATAGRLGLWLAAVAVVTAERCCALSVTLCTTPTSRSPGGSASSSSPPTATTISTSSRGCTLYAAMLDA